MLFFTCSDSESITWTSYGVKSSSSKIPAKTLPAFEFPGVEQVCKDTYTGVLSIPYYGGDGRYHATNKHHGNEVLSTPWFSFFMIFSDHEVPTYT